MMKKILILLCVVAFLLALAGCGDSSNKFKPYSVPLIVRSMSGSYAASIYTLDVEAKSTTKVNIPLPANAGYVSYNPNAGAALYGYSSTTTGTWEIFKMGSDGVEHQLTTKADAFEAIFSVDGTKIAYIGCSTGPCLVYTMNPDGSNAAPVYTETNVDQYSPIFSPDGKSLVFSRVPYSSSSVSVGSGTGMARGEHAQSHRRFRARVQPQAASTVTEGFYTLSLTTSGATPALVVATTQDWLPASFSLDQKSLLYTDCPASESCNIYSISIDGTGKPTQLTTAASTSSQGEGAFLAVPYNTSIIYNFETWVSSSSTDTFDVRMMKTDGSNSSVLVSSTTTYNQLSDEWWED